MTRRSLTLGIDTSLGTSVALLDGAEVVRSMLERDTRRHAEVIDVALAEVLGDDVAGVTTVVAGMGPGAFTGLRIGIVAARTFALGIGVPCVGILSHDALAVGEPGLVQVTTDVRRRERAVSLARDGRRIGWPTLAPHDAVPAVEGARRIDAEWIDAASLVRAFLAGAPHVDEAAYLREADAVPTAPKRVTA